MIKTLAAVLLGGVTSGWYCGGSELAIPPFEAWKLLNNSIEPARYSRAKVEYRSVRPEIPMSPVKSLRSRLAPSMIEGRMLVPAANWSRIEGSVNVDW